MKSGNIKLYLVLPCYNEEEIIESSAEILSGLYKELILEEFISQDSHILFVDDGSKDKTWEIICKLHYQDNMFEGIRLSKNKGHQIAIYAGTEIAIRYADAIITMDVDLQQDVGAIRQFIHMYREGYDVVYGVRNNREADGFFKKATATLYYKLLRIMGCEIIEQSADYRLLSKKAAEALVQYRESNLFIRGLVPTLGFKSGSVFFDVKERKAGKSKYTLNKMIQLALDGITSFSIRPIRLVLSMGILVSFISSAMIVYAVYTFAMGTPVSGWASLSASIWFLGGVQLIGIGVIGEYVGRTYMESKRRPHYFIEDYQMNGGVENACKD